VMGGGFSPAVRVVKCPCGHRACSQYTLTTQGSVGFSKANADLYAASPELYEVLSNVLSDLELGAHPHLYIEDIKAVLRKARGEA
jgi:hypothetical protein